MDTLHRACIMDTLYRACIMDTHTFTMHQAPGASCGILYILVLFFVLFMQSLYTLSNL